MSRKKTAPKIDRKKIAAEKAKNQRLYEKLQREFRQKVIDEFYNSNDCFIADSKMTLSYVMVSVAEDFIDDVQRIFRSHGIGTRLESKFKKLDEAMYDFIDEAGKFMTCKEGVNFSDIYKDCKKHFLEFNDGWVKANMYSTKKRTLEDMYGKSVAFDTFGDWEIDIYQQPDGLFAYDGSDLVNDPVGITGRGYDSIEQAFIVCKNLIPKHQDEMEEQRLEAEEAQRAKEEHERRIVENA